MDVDAGHRPEHALSWRGEARDEEGKHESETLWTRSNTLVHADVRLGLENLLERCQLHCSVADVGPLP